MREIVFSTETTGFEQGDGHRLRGFGAAKLAIKKTMR